MTKDRTVVEGKNIGDTLGNEPWGLRLRSSPGFVTFVVMFGILTDRLVYSLIIPVIPYQLEALGYDGIGAKVSWLLVAWSGTMVLTTPPIAYYSEVYRSRKVPILIGLVALIASQVMFMEAPAYWLMALARILQGLSSTVMWTVGLALLCDTVPEQFLGRQFGIVFVGDNIGSLVGPPVAGILYQRWGFRAPFIFGIIITGIDLLARLLLIERHESMRWGVDPMAVTVSDEVGDPEVASGVAALKRLSVLEPQLAAQEHSDNPPVCEGEDLANVEIKEEAREGNRGERQPQQSKKHRVTSLPHIVLLKLVKSPRARVCIVVSLIWGLILTAQETAIVLHMNRVWGLGPHQAGIALIAAIIPAIFSGALSGWLSDRYGSARIACAAILVSLPWFGLITIEGSLAVFLTFFALEVFFASGLPPALMLEISSVCKSNESVGYAHVYGALTLAYGAGTTAGPIMAGQMYDHIRRGWFAISFAAMGFMSVGLVLVLFMFGEQPLGVRPFQSDERAPEKQNLEEKSHEKTPQESAATISA